MVTEIKKSLEGQMLLLSKRLNESDAQNALGGVE